MCVPRNRILSYAFGMNQKLKEYTSWRPVWVCMGSGGSYMFMLSVLVKSQNT